MANNRHCPFAEKDCSPLCGLYYRDRGVCSLEAIAINLDNSEIDFNNVKDSIENFNNDICRAIYETH